MPLDKQVVGQPLGVDDRNGTLRLHVGGLGQDVARGPRIKTWLIVLYEVEQAALIDLLVLALLPGQQRKSVVGGPPRGGHEIVLGVYGQGLFPASSASHDVILERQIAVQGDDGPLAVIGVGPRHGIDFISHDDARLRKMVTQGIENLQSGLDAAENVFLRYRGNQQIESRANWCIGGSRNNGQNFGNFETGR